LQQEILRAAFWRVQDMLLGDYLGYYHSNISNFLSYPITLILDILVWASYELMTAQYTWDHELIHEMFSKCALLRI
jgi:hypothetical protein